MIEQPDGCLHMTCISHQQPACNLAKTPKRDTSEWPSVRRFSAVQKLMHQSERSGHAAGSDCLFRPQKVSVLPWTDKMQVRKYLSSMYISEHAGYAVCQVCLNVMHEVPAVCWSALVVGHPPGTEILLRPNASRGGCLAVTCMSAR